MDEQFFAHEQVVVRRDRQSGLTAIIAVHSTQLGPATGGCRRWRYADIDAARTDALRLAESMTYKNALAGLPFGGGKSVIVADDNRRPNPAQLQCFAQWLNELQGRYITAEDVGMGVPEMRAIAAVTPYVSGLGEGGIGGDPSPKTAYGVFLGLKAAVQYKFGVEHLHGIRVAVQGLGSVGMTLCHWLARAGAQLIVTDLDVERVHLAEQKYAAVGVAPDQLLQEIRLQKSVDVFAPCALGGVISEQVAMDLDVAVIAGAANNQLATPGCGDILAQRGVLYAPDFVINAAGVISVAHEYLAQQSLFREDAANSVENWAGSRIDAIPHRLMNILQIAHAHGTSTDRVARDMALEIVRGGRLDQANSQAA